VIQSRGSGFQTLIKLAVASIPISFNFVHLYWKTQENATFVSSTLEMAQSFYRLLNYFTLKSLYNNKVVTIHSYSVHQTSNILWLYHNFPSPITPSPGIFLNALQYINFTLSLAVGLGICSPVDIPRPTIGMY